MNTNKFSVDYFKEALRIHINKNRDAVEPVHAANSYYRSIVSSSLYENRQKSLDVILRLRNLDQAYKEIREELRNEQTNN
jgi:hypothetical protein